MICTIQSVEPINDTVLSVLFMNGVKKTYDIRHLYNKLPQFRQLEDDHDLFKSVKTDAGGYGISWNDELDLACEELWCNGTEC
ncbi:MAG: DUF2442 domain-containing protein [Lachnospiraceae bacterium]|nr:DUF2442 domain-containing protein [Lachnospiraceae bacterium]